MTARAPTSWRQASIYRLLCINRIAARHEPGMRPPFLGKGLAGFVCTQPVLADAPHVGMRRIEQGIRNKAVNERSMKDERYALLRQHTYDAARWREPSSAAAASESPSEDLIEDILRGRADLVDLTPVGALSLPILWFAPPIDRERVHWIAHGAPVALAPAGPAAQRDGIALEVARAHAWAPLLYSKSLLTGHSVDVACALFTGRSPVTADLSRAYSVR